MKHLYYIKKNIPFSLKQLYHHLRIFLQYFPRAVFRSAKAVLKKHGEYVYPKTIQLPITFKCNFDCVMCGMRHLAYKPGFSPEELKAILKDELYKKVISVGVNGGEPFLLKNLNEYIEVICSCLPELKDIYIITNGFFSDAVLDSSKEILSTCHKYNVSYHLSVSLDGYGKMHDTMRGKAGAFDHAIETCFKIQEDRPAYCDSFGTICTITKINVYNLAELDVWALSNNIPINYNIATIHKRIDNADKYEDFSVFTDEHARLMAAEFFYSKFLETKSEYYYSLYYFVAHQKRISFCSHQTDTVTLTPDGNLSYCAVFSEVIGNAFKESSKNIFFDKENINYRSSMKKEHCETCSHYTGIIEPKSFLKSYVKELLLNSTQFFYF